MSSKLEVFRDVNYCLQVYAEPWEVLRIISQGLKLRVKMPKDSSVATPAREPGTRICQNVAAACKLCLVFPIAVMK